VAERRKTAELLHASSNRSVIVIEHDMNFVADIAHKVTVLHQGKVLSEGSMEKVQADPASSKSISAIEEEKADAEDPRPPRRLRRVEVLHGLNARSHPARSSPSWAATAWARPR
jgi:ABC-type glutathione transport system ATPase component